MILKFLKKQAVDDSNQNEKLDVRIIASTSKDLSQEIKEGNFLQELYYRLNVIGIEIPTLRSRVEDIPLLRVSAFLLFVLEMTCDGIKSACELLITGIA